MQTGTVNKHFDINTINGLGDKMGYFSFRAHCTTGLSSGEKTAFIRGCLNQIANLCGLFLVTIMLQNPASAQLVDGFIEEPVGGTWNTAVGLAFDPNGRLYVWEKGGRVWIVENDVRLPAPLLDISEEVGNWRDHGMLGFALSPNFLNNGYLYVMYSVDRHHLFNCSEPASGTGVP